MNARPSMLELNVPCDDCQKNVAGIFVCTGCWEGGEVITQDGFELHRTMWAARITELEQELAAAKESEAESYARYETARDARDAAIKRWEDDEVRKASCCDRMEQDLAAAVKLLRHVDDASLNDLTDLEWMKANAEWASKVTAFLASLPK